MLKKLVNCIHYLGTRFIIMADTEAVVDTTYTLNWGMILQLAADDETFRDSVSTTTLQHSDRQNPACATELMATWSLVTKAGFLSLGAYFQAGFLLLSAFYDRTLTVFERAENAWVAFTFFTLWGEHSKKYNASENFITRQTFNDLITTANGLVLYFVDLVDHPNAPIVPWFLSSDHNEQLFARIRIGQYSGRRTQIDSGRVPDAMGRFNRLLEVENTLDVECNTNVFKTAHTRGKTLFPSSWSKHPDNPIVTELGRSITLKKLIESLKKGSKIGEKLFVSSSNYGQSYLLNDDGQPTERGTVFSSPNLMVLTNSLMNQTTKVMRMLKTMILWIINPWSQSGENRSIHALLLQNIAKIWVERTLELKVGGRSSSGQTLRPALAYIAQHVKFKQMSAIVKS